MNQSERLSLLLPERTKTPKPVVFTSTLSERIQLDKKLDLNEDEEQSLKEILITTKHELSGLDGKNHSRPFICAYYLIEHFTNSHVDSAQHSLELADSNGFALHFDLAWGAQFLASSIVLAELEISGELKDSKNEIESITKQLSEKHHDIDTISLFEQLDEFAPLLAHSLMKDPSGFETVDAVVSYLDEHFDQLPSSVYLVKPVFLVGAKTAAVKYKAIYPLTENLP